MEKKRINSANMNVLVRTFVLFVLSATTLRALPSAIRIGAIFTGELLLLHSRWLTKYTFWQSRFDFNEVCVWLLHDFARGDDMHKCKYDV